MTRTITRLFDSRADAECAIDELQRFGIDRDDISVIAPKGSDGGTGGDGQHDHDGVNDHGDVSRGVTTGAALGGAGGLLAGLGLLAIPGLGPVVAAGWLVATVTGAGIGAAGGGVTGSIVGALKNSGESDEDAHVYSEGVRRGGTLLSVRVADAQAAEVESALQRYNAVDATTRGRDYRASGWSGFDETGEGDYGATPSSNTRLEDTTRV